VGIGDAPVDQLALGIVRAGQTPGTGGAQLRRHVGPGVAAGLAGSRRGVEAPDLAAGLGVVRRDEALRPDIRDAGPVGDDLAVWPPSSPLVSHRSLPAAASSASR